MEKEEKEGGKKGIMQEKRKLSISTQESYKWFPICNMKSFCCIYLQKSLKTEFCIKIAYKKVWRICEMYMFLQGNRSDQLEVSYYAISSHLNNQNSRKPVVRAFFTHIDAVITRNNEVSRPKYFFNHHHLLDIMPVYHHMQN